MLIFMTALHALILGLVEGITEFLPISSTGHLIIVSKLFALSETEFLKSFEIVIQLGAILAVIVLYWKKLWQKQMIALLIVAFIPTGVIGLIAYSFVKQYLLGNSIVVIFSLVLGGIAMIIFEKVYARGVNRANETDPSFNSVSLPAARIGYTQALPLGLCQSIALVPGVSRAAATIVGGLLMGLPRKTIVEFSFLLAVPTMLAASLLDLLKSGARFRAGEYELLALGFFVAFVTALITIKGLLRFIKNHTFISFGIYRIIAGVIFALFIL